MVPRGCEKRLWEATAALLGVQTHRCPIGLCEAVARRTPSSLCKRSGKGSCWYLMGKPWGRSPTCKGLVLWASLYGTAMEPTLRPVGSVSSRVERRNRRSVGEGTPALCSTLSLRGRPKGATREGRTERGGLTPPLVHHGAVGNRAVFPIRGRRDLCV